LSTALPSRAETVGSAPSEETVPTIRAHAPPSAFASAVESLDEVIHQKARLGIMSTLLALGEADFKLLKETLGLSDGNLSTHLALLEERGYITVRKEFRGRKPRTTAQPTDSGRAAFQEYLAALERIIQGLGKQD
jgi:DNA-binding HxlR family transcriptional regulator